MSFSRSAHHHRLASWYSGAVAGLALAAPLHAAASVAPAPSSAPAAPTAQKAGTPASEIKGLLRLGSSLADRGDYSTAEMAYWQVLNRADLTPADEKDALLGLAHMLRKEGTAALISHPDVLSQQVSGSTVVSHQDALSQQGSLVKAAAIYEKFVKEFPEDERIPDALLDLGRTLRDMGAYKLAISRFYSVINAAIKFPAQSFDHYALLAKTAQFEIAETYFEAGQYAEAAKFFSRVRLLDLAASDRARADFMAAFSQQLNGDLETSVATLRAFLEQWPSDANAPQARYLLATGLRKLKRPDEAMKVTLDLLRDASADAGADPRQWAYWQRRTGNQIANEFFENGDTMNALQIYRGLRDLSPEPEWQLPVVYQIGLCCERLGQLEDARSAYQAIVDAGNPKQGQPAPSPEIVELAQMSSWRLARLGWRDHTDKDFQTIFTSPTPEPHKPS